MQAYFVGEIFYRVKHELKLHTALDTQGFLAAHLEDDWFENVDLVLLDIKHIDPEKYENVKVSVDCIIDHFRIIVIIAIHNLLLH